MGWLNQGNLSTDDLPKAYQDECEQYTNGDLRELSSTAKLLLAISYYGSLNDHGLLLNGKELSTIDRVITRHIMAAPNDMPFVIIYKNAPRSLVLPPRFQLVVKNDSQAEVIGQVTDYVKLRDRIISKLNAVIKPSNVVDDIFGLDVS